MVSLVRQGCGGGCVDVSFRYRGSFPKAASWTRTHRMWTNEKEAHMRQDGIKPYPVRIKELRAGARLHPKRFSAD